MGRLAIAAIVFLLSLTSALVPAESRVDSAPEWNRGDRWEYRITVQGPADRTYGNLTQEVSAAGAVRLGNRTIDAYTLTTRQTLSGSGVNTTTVSTVYVSQSDLCVLYVNSTSVTRYGDLSSRARMEMRYDASDGRYRFPLTAGTDWNMEYNLTRTVLLDPGLRVENRTVYGQFTCEGAENISVPAGRFRALRISCTINSGNQSSYWYSDAVRGEVMRRELDGRTGSVTLYELKMYQRSPEQLPLLGTDTGRAMLLGGISTVLIVAAGLLLWTRRGKRKISQPEEAREAPPTSFHIEKGRDGLQLKIDTVNLMCPACRRVFTATAGAQAVKCPFCGKEGRLG